MRGWGRVAAVLVGGALLAALPYALAWGDLPEPMASHWGVDGQPDAAMSRALSLTVTLALVVVLGGLLSGLLARRSPTGGRSPSPEGLALAAFLAALGVGIAWISVLANRSAPTWTQAAPLGRGIVVVLLAAAGVGLMGYRLGRRWFPRPVEPDRPVPVVRLDPREPAAWIGTATSRGQLVLLVPAAAILLLLPDPFRWLAVLVAVLAILLARVQVRVDDAGLTVLLGGFCRVRRTPLRAIEAARAEHIDPSRWGGWGYRLVPDGSAVVIRAGDGIVLDLRNGRRFAVTVDDADRGAGMVNALLARQGGFL